jgi:ketosteroid isomerase-like protein
MSEITPMTVEGMKQFLQAFNLHDPDAIAEYCSEDVTFVTIRENKAVTGKGAVRDYFAKMFEDIKDVHFGQDSHWMDGDRGCSEWVFTGTNSSGERMEVHGCDLFIFRDGKIWRKDSYMKQT